MSKTFRQLYEGHKGKVSDNWSLYLDEWDRLFASYRGQQIRLLEIGVQNGGSLEVWGRYFSKAEKIVGCDIDQKCGQLRYTDARITVIVSDANSDDGESKILQQAPTFDVVIDDGSHRSSDIVRSFARYFPHLNDGGIYVAEDLHGSYWEDLEGGLYNPLSAMAFFKRLADVVNYEHWRNNKLRGSLLAKFAMEFGIEFDEFDLPRIHSIEFVNSICIIRKLPPDKNVLGKRIVVGTDESVTTGGWKKLNNTSIHDLAVVIKDDENLDVFELIKAVQALTAREAEKQQVIQALSTQVAEKEQVIQELSTQVAEKEQVIQELTAQVNEKERIIQEERVDAAKKALEAGLFSSQLYEIRNSASWKLIHRWWRVRLFLAPHNSSRERLAYWLMKQARAIRNGLVRSKKTTSSEADVYKKWIEINEPREDELNRQKKLALRLPFCPLISLVTPVYNPPVSILRDTIESVLEQTYPNWELCIANGDAQNRVVKSLLTRYQRKDKRIRLTHLNQNQGIAGNTNAAIGMAGGEYVAFLDHDDMLAPFALFEVASSICEDSSTDLFFSDEDKITEKGERFGEFFKPGFSPDLLRTVNYMPHFLVARKSLGDQIGWIRSGFDGAQDYDFVLRATEITKKIVRIPKILYHWRSVPGSAASASNAKPYAGVSGKRALQEHLQRLGLSGKVENSVMSTWYKVRYDLPEQPLVSIIIPSHNHAEDLKRCVNSILEKSTYFNFEIRIVENNSSQAEVFSLYEQLKQQDARISVIEWKKPFNYSLVNNWAVHQAKGEVLLFLNNDTEVISPDWLEQMLMHALRPGIGMVGAKLYYPNDVVQHAGVIIGIGGVAGHGHKGCTRSSWGHFGQLMQVRNVTAVTAACVMARRQVFEEVNGFDERYVLAFGDVDLCLKVCEKGYLNLWTPSAELYHHESRTRGYETTPEQVVRARREGAYFKHKWAAWLLKGDPYYNPNLSLDHEDFRLDLTVRK